MHSGRQQSSADLETQGGCRVSVAPHSKVSQFCKPRGRRTGFPRCKWPSSALSLVTDRRALMGRGLVQGSSWAPRTCPWWVLQVRKCPPGEIGTSALRHRANRSSDARKDPLIRRAVSTLVYATLLHPAQGLLPMTMHPPESAGFGAGGPAGACRRRPCWSRFNRQDDHQRG